MVRVIRWSVAIAVLACVTTAFSQDNPQRPPMPPFDPALMIQGEYVGEVPMSEGGASTKLGVQVVALGGDVFNVLIFEGGLPGEEGVAWPPIGQEEITVTRDGNKVTASGNGWSAELSAGPRGPRPQGERPQANRPQGERPQRGMRGPGFVVPVTVGDQSYEFRKVWRRSETLGAKAPEGAIVLFEGNPFGGPFGGPRGPRPQGERGQRPQGSGPAINVSTDNLESGKVEEGTGLLMAEGGVMTKGRFQSFQLHLEFRTPFMPEARGQGRGNSGLYIQGRYEIQILDSFGLEPKDNECGGLYQQSVPRVNACFPPMTWQTYDVDYTAAQFDADGNKTAPSHLVVKLNGIEIQNLDMQHETPGGVVTPTEVPEAGPIFLQDHGNPVRFRNFWILEK